MNAKVLMVSILALSLVGVGALGILSMDSENSEGAETVIVSGTVNAKQGESCSFEIIDPSWAYNMGLSGVGFTFEAPGLSVESGASVGYRPWSYNSSTHMVTFIPLTYGTFTVSAELWDADSGVTEDESSFLLIVSPSAPLDFANPPTIDMVSGQRMVYTPSTNIPSTITLESGGPSWITFSGGVLTVNAPDVTEKTTYTAVLKATAGSQTATQTITVTVTPELEVVSTFPVGEFVAGHLYSYSPGANITSATWKIQGGPSWLAWDETTQTVKGTVPSNITEIGTVTFTLVASTTGPGQTAIQTVTVHVVPVLGFTTIPTADMIVTPIQGMARTYQFTPAGDNVESILWDFGDGTTSTEWAPIHTYADDGEYEVMVTMSNPLGSSSVSVILDVDDGSSLWDDYGHYVIAVIIAFAVLSLLYCVVARRGA